MSLLTTKQKNALDAWGKSDPALRRGLTGRNIELGTLLDSNMVKSNFTAVTAPGVGDDVNDGYSVGSVWIDTVGAARYQCVDASAGAAVWQVVVDPSLPNKLHNFAGAVAPTVNEDTGDGYAVGSLWFDTTNDQAYACVDATLGAAVWLHLNDLLSTVTHNLSAAVAPAAATDDVTLGYGPGSLWIDTTGDVAYVCLDGTNGAAVWVRFTSVLLSVVHKLDGAAPPAAATDDVTLGYGPGSIWVDTTNDIAYLCLDGTDGAAIWRRITQPLSNYAAAVAPAVTDDSGDGYSVGSNWYDTTADDAYVCLDATVGAAVWKKTTP